MTKNNDTSDSDDAVPTKVRKTRRSGGFAVVQVDRTPTKDTSCYRLTVMADNFNSRGAARAHLRSQIATNAWPWKDLEYGVIQIKDLELKPQVEAQVKITGV